MSNGTDLPTRTYHVRIVNCKAPQKITGALLGKAQTFIFNWRSMAEKWRCHHPPRPTGGLVSTQLSFKVAIRAASVSGCPFSKDNGQSGWCWAAWQVGRWSYTMETVQIGPVRSLDVKKNNRDRDRNKGR